MEEPSTHGEVPIWARPEKERRPTLTRPAVVAAAIRLADAEGLAAVSIRRVAAELGGRTMSLYTHIDSKDDLLDLMREQVAAEVVIKGDLPADWRTAIRLIATRERETALRHPWMIHMLTHAGHLGPNALRHLDQSLKALAPLTPDPRAALHVATAIDHYVIGHVIGEITRHPTDVFTQPYTRTLLESGTFPTLAPPRRRRPPISRQHLRARSKLAPRRHRVRLRCSIRVTPATNFTDAPRPAPISATVALSDRSITRGQSGFVLRPTRRSGRPWQQSPAGHP